MRGELMDVAARFLDRARRRHGDGLEAFMVVARAFADVLLIAAPVEAEQLAPPAPAKTHGGGRAKKRRVKAKPENAAPPIAPVVKKEIPPAKPTPAKVAPVKAAPAPRVTELTVSSPNGIAVSREVGEESIRIGDHVYDLTDRQACFLATLAAASPQPVGREFIAKRIWAGKAIPEFYETILTTLATELRAPLGIMGLDLKTVRGVGFALQAAEIPATGEGA